MAREKQGPERGLAVWQPFQDIKEMGRRFEDFFGRPFLPAIWRRFSSEEMAWSPAIYSESSYGSFSRSVTMPSTVDTSKIEASYDKGVLEIILPKAPEVKAKKIKVAGKKKEEPTGKKRAAGKKQE